MSAVDESVLSDSDYDDIPDVNICQERCEQFAALTGTDTACAQFFLQDRKWDLNISVNAYFDSQKEDQADVEIIDDEDKAENNSHGMASNAGSGNLEKAVKKLKFITWNIDGLDYTSLEKRFVTVCNIINSESANVVHLQEVVPETFVYIKDLLPAYKCIPGNNPIASDYFTVTLLRRDSVIYESHEVISFPLSRMGRNLLIVKIKIAGKQLTLLNSHLESTAEHSAERKNQLKIAFQKSLAVDSGQTVLLAGDLNLRDKELDQLGGVPSSMEDLWVKCGSRPECKFTWDSQRNVNIQSKVSFKARCRFDRIYYRAADANPIFPEHFGLIGLEKISSCGRFPSDHWGLVTYFGV